MTPNSIAFLVALGCLAPAARAQRAVSPSPLDPASVRATTQGIALDPLPEHVAALAALDSVVLHDFVLPDGALVDLELERVSVASRRFGFRVDGVRRDDLLDGLSLSVWKGAVAGAPDSSAMLSFSHVGSRGWIQIGGELVHLMPRPDADGDWSRGDVLLATEAALNAEGTTFDFTCEAKRPNTLAGETQRVPRTPSAGPSTLGGALALGGQCGLRECSIAVESDFQLYQQFNDLSALTAYVATLYTFVSDRYETQASTVLTFPYVQFYTTSNDPWTAQDTGGNCQAVLQQFQQTWVGNIPTDARLGHLMSGANLGCGVAWLDVLCSETLNFSVSGNLDGNLQFPVVQQPNNWDFIVVAHEIGHNFDALHTHDYCPPLDSCAPNGYFGQCQTSQVCSNQGSIMSYCHLCSGGTANITTFFHPTSSADMTAAAQACLPSYVAIEGDTPTLLAPNVATPLTVTVTGTPVGQVNLFYRFGAGSFSLIRMTALGGGQYAVTLPPAPCGSMPQFYYAFQDAACGAQTDPAGAPANFHTALVGTENVALADDFEADLGWTPTVIGATSGAWQRGVPVNAANWEYDPASDADGSGQCWLTGNASGNTDVDGGAVRLQSPAFSLAGGDALITYAYYLRLTNTNGVDRLLVEASSNGANGPWVQVASHATDSPAWRTHAIDAADLAAAGVAQTADMRLRFTANDGDPASIVEAGLDAFRAGVLTCGVGTAYCSPTANSTGQPALLSATGSASVGANDLALQAAPVPTFSSGVVFFGSGQTNVPLGNGFRCVAGTLFRLPPSVTSSGALAFAVDNALPPAAGNLVAGSTWNFQAWYRDVPAGGALFNLSNGYQITFAP